MAIYDDRHQSKTNTKNPRNCKTKIKETQVQDLKFEARNGGMKMKTN